jgi:hypothetical protein
MDLLRRIAERFRCQYRFGSSSEDTLIGLLALGMVIGGIAPTVSSATEILRKHRGQ